MPSWKSNTNPMFRSQFSESIFNHKYAHEGAETWEELCATLSQEVCGGLMPQDDIDQLRQYMVEMKFIPGGRYLYYAGRPNPFYNNCFAAGTRVLTADGWRFVEALGEAQVISPIDGKPYPANFHYHGVQPIFDYTFVPVRGRSNVEYKVRATRDHKWRLADGSSTEHLVEGQIIPASTVDLSDTSNIGFAHGFVFGDGNANGQLRLCGLKVGHLDDLARFGSVTYPASAGSDPVVYFPQKIDWKCLPQTDDPVYIASFIRGWLSADGSGGRILCSIDREALEWFRDNAALAGITISGELRSQIRNVQIGQYAYADHEIFIQNYSENWSGFKLKSVEFSGHEDVYCPYEPVHNQIIIDHNIHTYQCYLLRAEEDTREDQEHCPLIVN